MSVAFAIEAPSRSGYWSTEEDAILREYYLQRNGAVRVAEMTGRDIKSVWKRADRIGMGKWRRWSAADEERLRMLWGEKSLPEIAAALQRTEIACADHMAVLGVSRRIRNASEITTQGRRTGFHKDTLRKILDWAGVTPLPDVSIREPGAGFRRHLFDPDHVDRAIEKWLKTESVGQAAAVRGLSAETLRRRLVRSGLRLPTRTLGKGYHWRVPTATIDKALAMVGGGWEMRRRFPAKRKGQ